MDRFHLITLSVAVVALIVTLTLAGIALQFNSEQQKFPPSHDECPTGWTMDSGSGRCGNGDGKFTPKSSSWKNTLTSPASRGTHDVKEVDMCVKKGWANRHGVYWDGVTNYNGC